VGDEIQMECDNEENVSGNVCAIEEGDADDEWNALSLLNLGPEKT